MAGLGGKGLKNTCLIKLVLSAQDITSGIWKSNDKIMTVEACTCMQSFSWAKQHACCKLHMWTILRVRFARVSKPLNWSAITTKYIDRNNWTFFKIHYSVFIQKESWGSSSWGSSKKTTELKTDTKKPDKTDLLFWASFGPS